MKDNKAQDSTKTLDQIVSVLKRFYTLSDGYLKTIVEWTQLYNLLFTDVRNEKLLGFVMMRPIKDVNDTFDISKHDFNSNIISLDFLYLEENHSINKLYKDFRQALPNVETFTFIRKAKNNFKLKVYSADRLYRLIQHKKGKL